MYTATITCTRTTASTIPFTAGAAVRCAVFSIPRGHRRTADWSNIRTRWKSMSGDAFPQYASSWRITAIPDRRRHEVASTRTLHRSLGACRGDFSVDVFRELPRLCGAPADMGWLTCRYGKFMYGSDWPLVRVDHLHRTDPAADAGEIPSARSFTITPGAFLPDLTTFNGISPDKSALPVFGIRVAEKQVNVLLLRLDVFKGLDPARQCRYRPRPLRHAAQRHPFGKPDFFPPLSRRIQRTAGGGAPMSSAGWRLYVLSDSSGICR